MLYDYHLLRCSCRISFQPTLLTPSPPNTPVQFLIDRSLLKHDAQAMIRPLVCKQTMPIRGRSHLMNNFVAVAGDENPWLRDLDVDGLNARLEARRRQHAALVESGEFWDLPLAAKEAVSPEVRRVRWMDLSEAFALALSSMHFQRPPLENCVNAFQRDGFVRHGVKRRDPMLMTAVTLLELEAFPSAEALCRHCDRLEAGRGGRGETTAGAKVAADEERSERLERSEGSMTRALATLQAEIQFLYEGMTSEEVGRAVEPAVMIKSWSQVDALRRGWEARLGEVEVGGVGEVEGASAGGGTGGGTGRDAEERTAEKEDEEGGEPRARL